MNLWQICEARYFPSNPNIRDPKTKKCYRRALNKLSRVVGHEPLPEDLTDENIRAMMAMVVQSRRSPVTANENKAKLCALWRWMAEHRMVSEFPRLAKLPCPKRVPRAWTQDQLARLMKACKKAPGQIGGVPAWLWWIGWHCVAWDTGERTTAINSLLWAWLDERGVLSVPAEARKGKNRDGTYQLMGDTLAVLHEIRKRQPRKAKRIFHGLGHSSAFYKRYTTILKRAGLPTDRTCKPQKMRRSHASWLKACGGDPTASLMHSSDAITRESYLDPTIVEEPHAAKLFRILPTDDRRRVFRG